jgi:hypothetical protein
MAKGMYIGVGGVARKGKKAYVGVANVARKVKKMYVGIGGVARLCYSAGLSYTATTALPSKYVYLSALKQVGTKVILGNSGGSYSYSIDSNLVFSDVTNLRRTRNYAMETCTPTHTFFMGGMYDGSDSGYVDSNGNSFRVDAVNSSLVTTTTTFLSSIRGGNGVGGSVGGYALAIGRLRDDGSTNYRYADVDTFSSTLVRGTASTLYLATSHNSAANAGNSYLITAGGRTSPTSSTGYAYSYSTSLVRTLLAALSSERYGCIAVSVGENAIFIGGYEASAYSTVVETYNSSLVKSSLAAYPMAIVNFTTAIASTYDAAYIVNSDITVYMTTNISSYDKSLVLTPSVSNLTVARTSAATGVLDSKVIFAGGNDYTLASPYKTTTVDVYEY